MYLLTGQALYTWTRGLDFALTSSRWGVYIYCCNQRAKHIQSIINYVIVIEMTATLYSTLLPRGALLCHVSRSVPRFYYSTGDL